MSLVKSALIVVSLALSLELAASGNRADSSAAGTHLVDLSAIAPGSMRTEKVAMRAPILPQTSALSSPACTEVRVRLPMNAGCEEHQLARP